MCVTGWCNLWLNQSGASCGRSQLIEHRVPVSLFIVIYYNYRRDLPVQWSNGGKCRSTWFDTVRLSGTTMVTNAIIDVSLKR
jgi:hypothetical protein